jgi:hypothetical protein
MGPEQFRGRNYAGEVTASVGYTCEPYGSGSAILRFSYTVTRNGNRVEIKEPITVVTTQPYFGGSRWWFICPLIVNGRGCQRRARILYLPPGGTHFGCRTCYNLTYESVRTHDNRVGRLLRSPAEILAALESKNYATKFLGMKAYCKIRGFL